MHFTTLLITLATTLGSVSAGINCNGSGNCPGIVGDVDGIINLASEIDDNRVYQNHENIVCIQSALGNGLCAFLQNTGGIRGDTIKSLVAQLKGHGCKKCGSIPVFFPSDNSESAHGILTINAVTSTHGCDGVC
ncbi:hypothetical protein NQ176_g4002 [Zarea fungicola]|uniref:Uncharacterized protein n=1 Tax=Zarea fungicola TaxID=93591 RepID=A0ACC1NGT6_9HYPO|nr:hypothetical protein NQ176_g4002 [Lecanicillium fungicola]